MPREIVLDVPKISIFGDSQMLIENHRGIIQYNETKIRFNTNIGEFIITGAELSIKDISQEAMSIEGKISGISITD